jgi:hypothetical protein
MKTPCTLILNKQKSHFFYKIGEQEDRTGSVWGVGISGRREGRKGKGVGGSICYKYSVHTYINLLKLFQEWGEG